MFETQTPIEVRYAETDQMGVVYHANYLLYLEDGRLDFVNTVVMPYKEIEAAGYLCPVRSVEMTYYEPLHWGEKGFVTTGVTRLSPTKVTYHQRVFREGMDPETDHPLFVADVTACMVEKGTFKPVSMKRAFPELYANYTASMEAESANAS